jgi:hypothetical protein
VQTAEAAAVEAAKVLRDKGTMVAVMVLFKAAAAVILRLALLRVGIMAAAVGLVLI